MSLRISLTRAACAVALAVVATVAAACTDKVEQPTAPKAAAAVPVAAAVVTTPARAANGSTVCLAYMSKRADAKVRFDKAAERAKTLAAKKLTETLAQAKARAELKRKFEKTEAMMSDACR